MTPGTEEFQNTDALLTWQRKILRDIVINGLRGGIDIRSVGGLASADSGSPLSNRIDGIVVNPNFYFDNSSNSPIPRIQSGDSFRFLSESEARLSVRELQQLMLDEVLHRGNSSVFGVIMERPEESIDQLGKLSIDMLQRRVANSLLIVVPFGSVTRTNDMSRDKWEYPVTPPVDARKFSRIVIPTCLAGTFAPVISDIGLPEERISWVDIVEKTLYLPRVKGVSNYASVEVATIVRVPDYYSYFVNQIDQGNSLFVHGVRLPTEDDLK